MSSELNSPRACFYVCLLIYIQAYSALLRRMKTVAVRSKYSLSPFFVPVQIIRTPSLLPVEFVLYYSLQWKIYLTIDALFWYIHLARMWCIMTRNCFVRISFIQLIYCISRDLRKWSVGNCADVRASMGG
jgi:hypothetical protein